MQAFFISIPQIPLVSAWNSAFCVGLHLDDVSPDVDWFLVAKR
jgi:hypothetical protein